ncbi:flagellar filament capping protein FliD [Candidatus Nitrotoga sp. AM1P]|uniref:flagellar filament capping protein FliD n=1 Tax=Candidatus Nitrotoga sp. AM1P TaxID=2559597 RepID=UPI0010B02409|nr:flagellar filament capping protein FliD [Candidatus Nitrotoga sp. AM1P]BBJ22509.1 flagellar hook capping protein FlgD [Candidatus Nitrotoga sp. AM1P]
MVTTTASATTGTSIDVNSIVGQLMAVEQQPITKLSVKEASYQAKLSAFGTIKSALATFQTALQGLSNASKFQAVNATPSDATIFSATATSTAITGSYSLDITSLAQAQKLVASGQTSSTAAIGAGAATTVTFDFGSISGGTFSAVTGVYTGAAFTSNGNATKSITIDSTNNSLQGIRDAINAGKMGVTATIINDGSDTPYRLALSSDNNGANNSLKISVTGDTAVSNLLTNDPAGIQNLAETVTAQNANFKVNGVTVSKNSNTIFDVIPGVTLNLNKITTSATSLTIVRDTAAISNSISGFVKAYNDLSSTLTTVSAYNPASKTGALLQGDSTVRSLQSQLRAALTTTITGTSGALTTLSQVGVSFQKDGSLALDSTKLGNAISNNFNDIASLFAAVGNATDSLVSFNSASSTTKPGNYAVNISQLATRGTAVGSAAANTTITAATNDTLNFTINGVNTSVTLTAATYTAQSLAAELQSKINSASELSTAGISVAVTQNAGVLSVTAANYGSGSSVAITGGNGALDLMGGAPIQTAGVNVAGTIGGITATGSGQTLTATSGDPQDLSISINGGVLGARGMLNYSQGYAYSLNKWSTSILAGDGVLVSRTNGINKSIADIGNQRTTLQARLVGIEQRYRMQYSALDAMLTSMNQTSTYLTQQLANLPKF